MAHLHSTANHCSGKYLCIESFLLPPRRFSGLWISSRSSLPCLLQPLLRPRRPAPPGRHRGPRASDLRRRRSTRSRRRHRGCLTVCWAPQHHLHLWAVAAMLACCASARNRRGRQRRWWKGDWTSAFHPHGQQCITESWLNVSRTTAPGRARYGRRSNHPFNLRLLEACSLLVLPATAGPPTTASFFDCSSVWLVRRPPTPATRAARSR